MNNSDYPMDPILYQVLKFILNISLKKHGEKINDNNVSIKIYVNKIKNRISFKVKTGHYLKLLTPETMKLLPSTENKITKDKNGENVSH